VPVRAVQEVRQPGVHRQQRAVPVDLAHLQDLLEGLLAERGVVREARVGHQQLHAAGSGDEPVDRLADRGRVGHVAGQDVVLPRQRVGERLELAPGARGQADGGPASGQSLGQGAADAARSPGDQRAGAGADLHRADL